MIKILPGGMNFGNGTKVLDLIGFLKRFHEYKNKTA
tara:strand:- start:530 stop:637 length:108 start_codon:yes stop_codon:yes gene_type:complete